MQNNPSTPGNEKRLAQRFHLPLKITFKLRGNPGIRHNASIKNISGEGICLSTNCPLRPSETIEAVIHDDQLSKQRFHVVCRVVWSKEIGKHEFLAGIQYLKIENRETFNTFICDNMINASL